MANASRKALMTKLKEAKANGYGNNIRDGKYRWVVDELGLRDGFKGTRFQARLVVLNSIQQVPVISPANPSKGKPADTELVVVPDPVGRAVDWLQTDLTKANSAGPANVRRMLESLFGGTIDNDDEYLATLAEACDLDEDGDPLKEPVRGARGMIIDGETRRIITAGNKIEILVVMWSHAKQTEAERLAYCKWLDDLAGYNAALPAKAAA